MQFLNHLTGETVTPKSWQEALQVMDYYKETQFPYVIETPTAWVEGKTLSDFFELCDAGHCSM